MRMVYQQEKFTRFNPSLGEVRQLLPHVTEIEVLFIQPTATQAFMDTDLAEKVNLTFANGTKLSIEGIYLWKFCDAVLPGLGDEEAGYDDTNVYCSMPSVALAERVRLAYSYMFSRGEIDFKYVPPVRAVLDLNAGRVVRLEAARMTDAVRERLHRTASAREVPQAAERLLATIKTCISGALSAPRVKLQRYAEGQYLRQRYVTEAWPDNVASTMTVKEFLAEFGPEEDTPWHRTWREIVDEKIRAEVGVVFGGSIEHLRRANPSLFLKVCGQLRIEASEDEPVDQAASIAVLEKTPEYMSFAFSLSALVLKPYLSATMSEYMSVVLFDVPGGEAASAGA